MGPNLVQNLPGSMGHEGWRTVLFAQMPLTLHPMGWRSILPTPRRWCLTVWTTRTVSSRLCWQVSLVPGSARVGPTHRLLLLFVLPVETEMVEVFGTKESALVTSKFPSRSFFLYLNDIASSLPM